MRSLLILIVGFCSGAKAADTGAMLLGGFTSIFLHETGHALTAKVLGADVKVFRPFPTKVRFVKPDGETLEKWVAGLVVFTPFEGVAAEPKTAWVAAMGSVSNLLSVFLLAPLLPEMGSDFAKESLDSMLVFSSFDGAAYTAADLIFKSPYNDWSRVSKITGISLYWYFLGNLAGGILANSYRIHWAHKAFPNRTPASGLAVGATLLNIQF